VKKVLLISRCLLGERVRYDGKYQGLEAEILAELAADFELLPICPEVECGLPVPRPPMRLTRTKSGAVRLRRRSDDHDLTEQLAIWIGRYPLPQPGVLAGALLKSKSPSCGLGTTKLYSETGDLLPEPASGLFAAALRARFPDLPIASELDFREKLPKN